jgi:predicted DNA-binding protein
MNPRRGQRIVPKEQRKSRQIAVRLTEKEYRALERIGRREGLPVSYFIRKGIGLVIEQHAK